MPMPRSVPAMLKRPRTNSISADRGFQEVRRGLLAAFDHHVARLDDGAAALHHRARAAGAAAGDELIGIALQQPDLFERHAEPVRQHLRERRGVTLAVIERAGDDGDDAVVLETDAAHLVAGVARSPPGNGRCRGRAPCRARGFRPGARHSRPSRRRPAPYPCTVGNSPLSYSMPDGAAYGICSGWIWLRRRNSTRSMPISRAAVSTRRSM